MALRGEIAARAAQDYPLFMGATSVGKVKRGKRKMVKSKGAATALITGDAALKIAETDLFNRRSHH